jgi:hypothetical protein
MLSDVMLSVIYAEVGKIGLYAECHYAECHGALLGIPIVTLARG